MDLMIQIICCVNEFLLFLQGTSDADLYERCCRLLNVEDKGCVFLSDNYYIDRNQMTVVKDGMHIISSRIQFRILDCLAQKLGSPVSKIDIIQYVWGPNGMVQIDELYVYVNRIRKLLEENPKKPKYLVSIHGFGYGLYPKQVDVK